MNANIPPTLASLAPLATLAAASTAACLAGSLASRCLRKSSPASRHLVWLLVFAVTATATLAALLPWRYHWAVLPTVKASAIASPAALPIASAPVPMRTNEEPRLQEPKALSPQKAPNFPRTESPLRMQPAAPQHAWAQTLVGMVWIGWGLGICAMAAIHLLGTLRLGGILRRATRLTPETKPGAALALAMKRAGLEQAVPLYVSTEVQVPLVAGIIRPVMVLPTAAAEWPENQLRAVFLHELAHVKRRDLPSLLFGRMVLAVHWFNPLLWAALAHLRAEAEQAADDEAAGRYGAATDYAADLVAMVRELKSARLGLLPAIGMENKASLEGRIKRLLSAVRPTWAPSPRQCASALAAAVLAVLAAGLVRPVAAQEKIAEQKTTETKNPPPATPAATPWHTDRQPYSIVLPALQKLTEASAHSLVNYTSTEVAGSGLAEYYEKLAAMKGGEKSALAQAREGQLIAQDDLKALIDGSTWWLDERRNATDSSTQPGRRGYGSKDGRTYLFDGRDNAILTGKSFTKPVPTLFTDYLTRRLTALDTNPQGDATLVEYLRAHASSQMGEISSEQGGDRIVLSNTYPVHFGEISARDVYRFEFTNAKPYPYLKSFSLLRKVPSTGESHPIIEVEYSGYYETPLGFSLPQTIVVKSHAVLPAGENGGPGLKSYDLFTRTLTLTDAKFNGEFNADFAETFSNAKTVVKEDREATSSSGLTGTVLDSQGKPVAGAKVVFESDPATRLEMKNGSLIPSASLSQKAGITDHDGHFALEGADKPGALYVENATGSAWMKSRDFHGKIQLQPWATVKGVVLSGGVPAANRAIQVHHGEFWVRGEPNLSCETVTKTDAQGHFQANRLRPGLTFVWVSPEKSPIWAREVERQYSMYLEPGKVTEIQMGGDGVTVTGQLTPAPEPPTTEHPSVAQVSLRNADEMKPLPYPLGSKEYAAALQAYYESPKGRKMLKNRRTFTTQVTADGSFSLANIPAGDYTLEAALPNSSAISYIAKSQQLKVAQVSISEAQQAAGGTLAMGAVKITPNQATPQVGDKAPDFTLTTRAGTSVRLSDLQGKIVLLRFAKRENSETNDDGDFLTLIRSLPNKEDLAVINIDLSKTPDYFNTQKTPDIAGWYDCYEGEKGEQGIAKAFAAESYPNYGVIARNGTFLEQPAGTPLLKITLQRALRKDFDAEAQRLLREHLSNSIQEMSENKTPNNPAK